MAGKAVISLSTGLKGPEKVTLAFLVATGAAESSRPTLMFQAKEPSGLRWTGRPPVSPTMAVPVCPVCFNAKQLGKRESLPNAEPAGSIRLSGFGDDGRRPSATDAEKPLDALW